MLWSLETRSFGERSPVMGVLHAAADPGKWPCSALGLGPSGTHKGAWPSPHLRLRKPQGRPQAEACLSLKKELRWTDQGGISNSWGAQVPEHIRFSEQVFPILLRIQSFVTDESLEEIPHCFSTLVTCSLLPPQGFLWGGSWGHHMVCLSVRQVFSSHLDTVWSETTVSNWVRNMTFICVSRGNGIKLTENWWLAFLKGILSSGRTDL